MQLATLVLRDQKNPSTGVLEISACRLGCYLTAGRGKVRIPVSDGPEFRRAISDLMSARDYEAAEIVLDRELWIVDSSLKADVITALATMKPAARASRRVAK